MLRESIVASGQSSLSQAAANASCSLKYIPIVLTIRASHPKHNGRFYAPIRRSDDVKFTILTVFRHLGQPNPKSAKPQMFLGVGKPSLDGFFRLTRMLR